jgi:hypothetical protein
MFVLFLKVTRHFCIKKLFSYQFICSKSIPVGLVGRNFEGQFWYTDFSRDAELQVFKIRPRNFGAIPGSTKHTSIYRMYVAHLFSRVRYLNPTSIRLPMSILMSRCKISKWVRLTAVFKRPKFKQKDKKETFPGGRETTFFGVILQCSTYYTTF